MSICKKQSYIYPLLLASFFACVFFLISIITEYPETQNIKNNIPDLKNLIDWGLKRQTTHAALTLSALVSLFSILRFNKTILEKCEIKLIYLTFLSYLSYEYFKLIKSFQIVGKWEDNLSNQSNFFSNAFKQDILQKIFLGTDFHQVVYQSIGLFLIIFFASRMYIITMQNSIAAHAQNVGVFY